MKFKPCMFFIPDISGFTKFINNVSKEHSAHLISELLEIIIDSNILNLKVSEIEGDAVFFYRMGKEPTFEELIQQVEVTYLAFHRYLQLYTGDRICQCGSYSTTPDLEIKFVYHYGKSFLKTIRNHQQLLGPDVTLAHRLLKNNINSNEYLVMTNVPVTSRDLREDKKFEILIGECQLDDYGTLCYSYITLNHLKSSITKPHEDLEVLSTSNKISASVSIERNFLDIHNVVNNESLKIHWIYGLRAVKDYSKGLGVYDPRNQYLKEIIEMNLHVVYQNPEDGVISYVNKCKRFSKFAPLRIEILIEKKSESLSEVTMNITYSFKKKFLQITDLPLKLMLALMSKISLLKLNRYMLKQ